MNLSVVIVSSPIPSHPDTFIIDSVIDSLNLIDGLERVNIVIILDGYVINDKVQTKKGKITTDMKLCYDEYYEKLKDKYCFPNFLIEKCENHLGFALAVKHGLALCRTDYALILQHDRKFVRRFSGISSLMECMEIHDHIRYIHFPTIMSSKHTSLLQRYGLHPLTNAELAYIPVSDECELRPLIFWYDSNHLCNIRRYMAIFSPYKSMPKSIRDIVNGTDNESLRKMLLKRGDFIEDKFGQVQRNVLVSLRGMQPDLMAVFRWFGSYFLWLENEAVGTPCAVDSFTNDMVELGDDVCPTGDGSLLPPPSAVYGDTVDNLYTTEDIAHSLPVSQTQSGPSCVMVAHLRGRHFDPSYLTHYDTSVTPH